MSHEDQLNSAAQELARALAGLSPTGHRLDRDMLMFRAGQAASRRLLRGWQSVACSLAVLLLGFAWLGHSPALVPTPPQQAKEIRPPVVQPTEVEPDELAAATASRWVSTNLGNDYLRLRARLAAEGLDALPTWETTAAPAPIESVADGLRQGRRQVPRTRWLRRTSEPGGTEQS
ncbi:MAG: hypothetical protein FJ387_15740 [Verrucomicrobia bacterium]|nr:hypothetical protein [Verrucomicrobiota bacterium]